jgi:hypothetical protein
MDSHIAGLAKDCTRNKAIVRVCTYMSCPATLRTDGLPKNDLACPSWSPLNGRRPKQRKCSQRPVPWGLNSKVYIHYGTVLFVCVDLLNAFVPCQRSCGSVADYLMTQLNHGFYAPVDCIDLFRKEDSGRKIHIYDTLAVFVYGRCHRVIGVCIGLSYTVCTELHQDNVPAIDCQAQIQQILPSDEAAPHPAHLPPSSGRAKPPADSTLPSQSIYTRANPARHHRWKLPFALRTLHHL